jgi:hypothetical protein
MGFNMLLIADTKVGSAYKRQAQEKEKYLRRV